MTRAEAAVKDIDVRGFVYALEPVRLREQWRMDKLLAELARAQKALQETEAQLEETQQMHDRQAQEAGRALLLHLDPGAHRRALAYLTQVRDRCSQLQAQREARRAACDGLRKECVAQRLRIEGLSLHKEQALKDYADELRQRNGAEQDRDWLARSIATRDMGAAAR